MMAATGRMSVRNVFEGRHYPRRGPASRRHSDRVRCRDASVQMPSVDDIDADFCAPAFVTCDSSQGSTMLSVRVCSLLRAIFFSRTAIPVRPNVLSSASRICSRLRALFVTALESVATVNARGAAAPLQGALQLASPQSVARPRHGCNYATSVNRHPCLHVQVLDYQGLLHVIAWVLKGMEVRVRSATMKVDDGMAEDAFELTTLNGSPLSDARAEDVVERVRSFVMHCAPKKENKAVEWRNGPILISNKNEDNETIVTVLESGTRVGFLLEIVSVLSGVGVHVTGASVYTCSECRSDPAFVNMMQDEAVHVTEGRVIRLQVVEPTGGKLMEKSVDSVLFTLGLLLGKGHTETMVPSISTYAIAFEE